jgi:hypothetical protein
MRTPQNLEEYRIRASRLMKDLRAADPVTTLQAAKRFQVLPAWQHSTLEQIAASRKRIQRKHALAVIAKEAGFQDWPQLKTASAANLPAGFDTTKLFQARSAGSLNLWFRNYEEARQAMTTEPKRYLFPYRHQFVVCETALLEDQGIETSDPDWERIGRDWAKPLDARAHARLAARLRRAIR